jgi:CheY-like chemotaxis protein
MSGPSQRVFPLFTPRPHAPLMRVAAPVPQPGCGGRGLTEKYQEPISLAGAAQMIGLLGLALLSNGVRLSLQIGRSLGADVGSKACESRGGSSCGGYESHKPNWQCKTTFWRTLTIRSSRHLGVRMICVPHNPLIQERQINCCSQRLAQFQTASRTPLGMLFLSSRELVFVVDDDPAMLRGVARVLKQHRYDAILFASARAFRRHNDYERAACIILDVNLNDGSGIELRRDLKAAGICVPVIYMTANDSPAVHAAALQSGCLAYLTKPFAAHSLIEPLKRASTGLT